MDQYSFVRIAMALFSGCDVTALKGLFLPIVIALRHISFVRLGLHHPFPELKPRPQKDCFTPVFPVAYV